MINIDHNSDKYHCLKAIKLLVVVTTQLPHQFTYFHFFFFLIKKCSCNNLIVVGSAFCDNYDDQFFPVCFFCFVFVGFIFFGSNTQQNHRLVDIIGYAFWCGSYPRSTRDTNTKDDLEKKRAFKICWNRAQLCGSFPFTCVSCGFSIFVSLHGSNLLVLIFDKLWSVCV